MNLLTITFSYISKRKLGTLLNVLLLALGVGTIVVLLLFNHQMEENLSRNARGIDAVVGAKGSPLQLILSSVYHLDVPTGNIALSDVAPLLQNPAIKSAIPLALGDSYNGFRIVGTSQQLLALYETQPQTGRNWESPLEVVVGATIAREAKLDIGAEITSAHGLSEDGDAHDEHHLTIVGILPKSGTALDRLVLTDVRTVWMLHHDDENAAHADSAALLPLSNRLGFAIHPDDSLQQITALLIKYSSPMAAALFPRFVNAQTNMQAASPAFETARLFDLFGVGVTALQAFGFVLIITAALSVFIALYNALKERRYDLAIMRTLGASREKIFWQMIQESILLSLMGVIAGLLLGHIATEMLGKWLAAARQIELTGWQFLGEEWAILILAIAIGILAAIIPAVLAYRTDISKVLAKG